MGNRGGVIGDRPSTPESDKKPSPPTGGSFVSVVFVVRGAGLDVCGGKIGEDDAKFCPLPCLADQNSCGRFIKHVKVKASLACPAYYIGATSKQGGGAFCHPALVAPHSGFSAVATSVMRDTTIPRTVAEWREVFTLPYIAFAQSSVQECVARALQAAGMTIEPVAEVKFIATATGMVRAGVGFAILPELALGMARVSDLVVLPISPAVTRKVGIVANNRRSLSPAAVVAREAVCRVVKAFERRRMGAPSTGETDLEQYGLPTETAAGFDAPAAKALAGHPNATAGM